MTPSVMAATAPFLRSPPFPWVATEVAAVSRVGAGAPAWDHEAVFAGIRQARIGGAFWAATDPWACPDDEPCAGPGDERAIIGWLAGGTVRDATGRAIDAAAIRAAAVRAIDAARYRDPFTGTAIDAAAAVAILAEWRRVFDANRPIAAATGMAMWKREALGRFLWDGTTGPRFVSAGEAVTRARRRGGAIAYWPSRTRQSVLAAAPEVPAWQVEDGFIRSSGLGAECYPPQSIIVDATGGIHYDPSRASALETTLATRDFDKALIARAARLRGAIVAARIGKYGVDRAQPVAALPTGRRTVLAIGQVEDDLSVAKGGGGVRGNLDFLRRVRREEPGAFIVYRPHPDVAAGLRRGQVPQAEALAVVDRVDTTSTLLTLIGLVDRVHVLSSLSGFEALLRGVPVTTHGLPFYAGWGLTRDLGPVPDRRGRVLPLDALVAAALILAPRYLDPETGLPCPPETLVARMAAGGPPRRTVVTGFRRALGATRRSMTLAGTAR